MGEVEKKASSYRLYMWAGAFFVVLEGVLVAINDVADLTTFVVVLMGYSVMTQDLWKYMGIEKPMKDERARKISTLAGLYSWYVTLSVACLAVLAISVFHIPMSGLQVAGALMVVATVTLLALDVYLNGRGDIE